MGKVAMREMIPTMTEFYDSLERHMYGFLVICRLESIYPHSRPAFQPEPGIESIRRPRTYSLANLYFLRRNCRGSSRGWLPFPKRPPSAENEPFLGMHEIDGDECDSRQRQPDSEEEPYSLRGLCEVGGHAEEAGGETKRDEEGGEEGEAG